jgi:hypothetical protein
MKNNCKFCYAENSINDCRCNMCGTIVCHEEPKNSPAPSLLKKVQNFTKSVVNHVANGMENVSSSVKEERMSICRACPFFNQTDPKNPTCNKCGCYLEIKTGWASEKCPEGKWHDIKTASAGGCGCNKS